CHPPSIHRTSFTSPLPFCFLGCRHHRDLHSFPTRRSSDLGCWENGFWRWRKTTSRCWCEVSGRRGANMSDERTSEKRREFLKGRSEEHTSELQSRENLVCRLLLEKKKKIKASQHGRRWITQ